jgi:ubiquinol-cytochrome c reductase cytochrome c1 subunit
MPALMTAFIAFSIASFVVIFVAFFVAFFVALVPELYSFELNMNLLKKLFVVATLAIGGAAFASSGGYPLDKAPDLSNDKVALQHGAKLFVNYCLNCHAAASMRYNRLKDIGLTDDQIKDNLLFSANKVGETMKVSIQPKDAKEWFGAVPPDLSVIARAKAGNGGSGADYIYTYLRTYYRDASRPTGWNNLAYAGSAMPHVLWDMQPARGLEKTEIIEIKDKDDKSLGFNKVFTAYDVTGAATPVTTKLADFHGHAETTYKFITEDIKGQQQFDKDAASITAFMQYMADPSASTRQSLGVWVLVFLGLLIIMAYLLNKQYWKDIK